MTQWYVQSTQAAGLRFRIVKLERESFRAQLVGDTGAAFERIISPDSLDKYGYIVVEEPDPPPTAAPQE
jgi:hypothetical protein